MTTIEIKNRHTSAVLYATDVEPDDPRPVRTTLVRAAAARANLRDANLRDADLGGADLGGANLRDANLRDADLGGADLGGADLGGANLRGADLGGANLGGANLRGADLGDADLGGANLGGADLGGAYRADLTGAYLVNARNLPAGIEAVDPPTPYVRRAGEDAAPDRAARRAERARLYREAHPDVPVIGQLDAKILARVEANPACLDMGLWHAACGTTHCRAGHAIDIAGKAGYELERRTDSHTAGRVIYLASTGRIPHFFASNERALEDIRRCAAEQLAAAQPAPSDATPTAG